MKETILSYTENRSGCKVASLDTEKAFDKTWRDGLFYKLINKIDYSFWFILKIYYDSSRGIIILEDGNYSSFFIIMVGVKQGGIISAFLFQIFIDDLIVEIIGSNLGAIINNINVSIIVYADDILLICSVDAHLQHLLDICNKFSEKWRLKFNANKSHIIEFGKQFYEKSIFYLNDTEITKSEKIDYLGISIDKNLDFDQYALDKFKNTQKSVFSLSFMGLKPSSISPILQAFIYKTYCLSQFTYALETTVIKKKTRDYLNVAQNNLLRQIIGLNKYCHMSKILKCLKIFKFEELYICAKLSFINSIKKNLITNSIFLHLCDAKRHKNRFSKSFCQDICLLESNYNRSIQDIYSDPSMFINTIKKPNTVSDGIVDSIYICLSNFKSKNYKILLYNLTKPNFIRDDEEFQDLLQYLIITDNHNI
jgi:hypothetical protein